MFIVAETGGISYFHRSTALMVTGLHGELFMIAKFLDFLNLEGQCQSYILSFRDFLFFYMFQYSSQNRRLLNYISIVN